MKIIDYSSRPERELSQVYISLTKEEMKEFRDSLDLLLNDSDLSRHEHINNKEFDKEITIEFDHWSM